MLTEPLIRKIHFSWTSDASGDASVVLNNVNGIIRRVASKPGADVSSTYGLAINDEHGIDVLNGAGSGVDGTQASQFAGGPTLSDGTNDQATGAAVAGDLTVVISGAGDTKTGEGWLYIA